MEYPRDLDGLDGVATIFEEFTVIAHLGMKDFLPCVGKYLNTLLFWSIDTVIYDKLFEIF